MPAGICNFTIEQGTTWGKTVYLTQRGIGKVLLEDSNASITVDATAKTFTRDDGGSWLDDGLQAGDYIVNAGFPEAENNASHIITTLTASVITCAASTLKSDSASPSVTGNKLVVLKARNLTGATGAAMIRKKYSSPTPAATITVAFNPATRLDGQVNFSLTDTQTSLIPCGEDVDASASQYVWDFEMVITPVKSRELEGVVKISPEATK